MLWEFKDISALTEEKVDLTHLYLLTPHHLPLAHQAAADNAIEEMTAGIIEPCDSGVVMVNKKKVQRRGSVWTTDH